MEMIIPLADDTMNMSSAKTWNKVYLAVTGKDCTSFTYGSDMIPDLKTIIFLLIVLRLKNKISAVSFHQHMKFKEYIG